MLMSLKSYQRDHHFPMDSRFTIQVLSQTPNPQQVIYAAMHQDYAEAFVWDDRAQFPDEPQAGELVIRNLLGGNRGHFGPLEHPQIVLNVGWFPHSCMQQIRTHRVGVSFDVQCLAGDTEVTFVKASGSLHKVKIAELHDLWSNGEQAVRERKIRGRNGEAPGAYRRDCKKRLQRMKLRVLNESTGAFEISHLQDVMCSGTQPVYRLTLADGKTLDCTTNHRLFTADGWQHMGEALGLVTDETNQVLAITRNCELMCNGVLRTDAIYSQKSWFAAQAQKGLTASEIAASAGCSVAVIRHWAKEHGIALCSGHQRGLKTLVGNGLYRDRAWLEAQLDQGLHADAMAQAAGCSIECIKKWVYHHGLALNKRPPGSPNPWNKGNGGYALNLTPESRKARQQNAKKYTRRGADSNFWKGGVASGCTMVGAWTRQIAPQVHEKFQYVCQSCGERGGQLHAHHLVPVFADESLAYEFDNLVSVCKPCHEQIHSEHREAEFAQNFQPRLNPQTWQPKPSPVGRKLMAHPVKVVQVEYLGMQTTYDLEVAGEWHNFVANGVVVHNSFRYTGTRILAVAEGKTEVEEVFYLRPLGFYTDRQGKKYEYLPEQREEDIAWCLAGAKLYKTRIDQGFAEEHARSLIPFDVRQHWVMSANVRSVMHLLDLRAKGDAQLEAQQMCELIWPHFETWVPAIAEWYHKQRWAKARLSP
jgi:thymidylate synthase (FAD)